MTDKNTQLIHHPYRPPADYEATMPGMFKSSSILFPDMASVRRRNARDRSGYTYGLHGTPTTYILEERLATLEGGRHCCLVPSGLAAVTLVNMALLQQGDELLLPDNVYAPNQTFSAGMLSRWGIAQQSYDAMNPDDLARKIGPRTRLVWLEAAGSVTMEFPDLVALTRICREKGVLVAIDNTWSAGIAYNSFDLDGQGLGVDVVAHALTKYPSGGGDVLMGAVTTASLERHQEIDRAHRLIGFNVGANDVELVLRSLPSLGMRYQAQDQSARQVARWCAEQAAFVQVLHPALPSGVGHENWQTICQAAEAAGQGAAASIFSVILDERYSQQQVDAFCDALKIFRLGYSWGGPMSLVMTYDLSAIRQPRPRYLQPGGLVRLVVGMESVQDLQADLQQALAAAGMA